MGIDNVDRMLASNRLVFEVRRDMKLYERFQHDYESLMDVYGLSDDEKEAWRTLNLKRLAEMGVHPYFLPQISRLFNGSGYNFNGSASCKAYAKTMVEDSAS